MGPTPAGRLAGRDEARTGHSDPLGGAENEALSIHLDWR
jgi:hypothetical protein